MNKQTAPARDTTIEFRSDFTTDVIEVAGSDDAVLQAMMISTLKDADVAGMDDAAKRGRINFLMKNRHGTPFEHNMIKFRSEAPIFVYREWHRHRIGVSINEQSGRYKELPPMFYVPPPERPLTQIGKPGAYEFVPGTPEQYDLLVNTIKMNAADSYFEYEALLNAGIAKEVARMVLPVNIYSSMYWTCNARSLMAFLSLRVREDEYWIKSEDSDHPEPGPHFFANPGGAMFPSKPQWEIDACARAMEQVFAEAFPLTHAAFIEFGRVCP